MTHGEPITSIGTGLLRIAAAILGKKSSRRAKHLKSRIGMWWLRRKYPPGYPLRVDFEPRSSKTSKA